jgi:antitoxin component of RelBE/YafQ-DinJ toxin-antitoxin module
MKKIKLLVSIVVITFLTSCATKAKFPVSTTVPAAEILVKKKTDNNKNITLEINAKNLASADRLSPAGNNYSVWIVTKDYGLKNVGQIQVKNGKKATFKTVTPFEFSEVFITVENQGDLSYPTGQEISRTKI